MRNNWKNQEELAYIFANMQMFFNMTDNVWTRSSSFV